MLVHSASEGSKYVKKDWEFQSAGHLDAFREAVKTLSEHGASARSLFAQMCNGGHISSPRGQQVSASVGMGSAKQGKVLSREMLGNAR